MSKKEDKIKEMERIIEESFNIMSDAEMYDEFFVEEEGVTIIPEVSKKDREKKKDDKE
tara:strand:+ start:1726 stop:1899 length:174 start_codon:yes stop_codon:yes gene_type:complete